MRPREVYPLLMRPIVAERNSTVIHHLRKSKIFPTSIDRFVLFCCSWKFWLSRLIPPSLAFASKLGPKLARPNISEMGYSYHGFPFLIWFLNYVLFKQIGFFFMRLWSPPPPPPPPPLPACFWLTCIRIPCQIWGNLCKLFHPPLASFQRLLKFI